MWRKTVAISIILAFLVIGCLMPVKAVPEQVVEEEPQPAVKELKSVEIREYKGEKLGSIDDFRENSIEGPQQVDIDKYKLEITGLVKERKAYTYDEVLEHQHYSKVITIHCVEGWGVNLLWEGVLLKDLFDEAGVKPAANTVIFHCYDGYTTSLPLDFIIDNDILLAYKMNDVVLPPERGYPFEVVAEDKLGYKWAKWVTKSNSRTKPTTAASGRAGGTATKPASIDSLPPPELRQLKTPLSGG